jgi:membrane protease YdiL (CAAX protease family)
LNVEEQTFPVGIAAAFYLVLAGIGWGLASGIWGLDVWYWREGMTDSFLVEAVIGAGFGLFVVWLTSIFEEHTAWAAKLSLEFRRLLGPITMGQALVLAVSSGIAEEVFFRGFLQQVLTEVLFSDLSIAALLGWIAASLVFGLVHQGPDPRTFLPWTIFALVVGAALGGLYWITGNLLAPVIAHFTINFLNLSLIGAEDLEQ